MYMPDGAGKSKQDLRKSAEKRLLFSSLRVASRRCDRVSAIGKVEWKDGGNLRPQCEAASGRAVTQSLKRLANNEMFWPPNPKLLLKAASQRCWRATFGT